MAVAVRADVLNKSDMEARTVIADGLCIFGHFPVQKFICIVVRIVDGVKAAGTDAAAAAFTLVIIDDSFPVYICDRIASAFFCTALAAATDFFTDCRFSAGMLLHLACTASAAHTDIFDGAAETGGLMAFKMCQADKYISVHDRMSDESCFAVFSVYDRNFDFIGSAETVTDDDLASGGDRVETVQVCTVEVIQGIFSASRI